ncbi:hypothetical protein [Paraburkholderia phytofirmans]|uniref:hypothetical protein n=1 Tax=Paraburkholderia phytofirmans TaxID=261302 RepID=UPI0011E047D0|nr:hypothetical protein [Paraburkholderia phytofirmans]
MAELSLIKNGSGAFAATIGVLLLAGAAHAGRGAPLASASEGAEVKLLSTVERNIRQAASSTASTSSNDPRCKQITTSINAAIASPERWLVYGVTGGDYSEQQYIYDRRLELEIEHLRLGCRPKIGASW